MRKNSQSAKLAPLPAMSPSPANAVRVPINGDVDIVKARQAGRRVAEDAGFVFTELALIATAISELARNIVRYARSGEIVIRPTTNSTRRSIQIVAQDSGPGIRDIELQFEFLPVYAGASGQLEIEGSRRRKR
jgi:serine/threonine-protein kinase RsbT